LSSAIINQIIFGICHDNLNSYCYWFQNCFLYLWL